MDHVPQILRYIPALAAEISFLILLALLLYELPQDLRNPLNWWSYITGQTVRCDMKKLSDREVGGEDGDAIHEEIHRWVVDNSTSRWIRVHPYCYKFLRSRDAVMFKLAWG